MNETTTIAAMAALAQPTRLDAFRLLVRHEPDGLPAGEIARELGAPHNTMSSHLAILQRAGLIGSERRSRSVIYRADLDRLRAVMLFLVEDCCQGRSELRRPLVDSLLSCRPKEPADG